ASRVDGMGPERVAAGGARSAAFAAAGRGGAPRGRRGTALTQQRAGAARGGLDAYLLYTNLVRPAAVCWLTGFTPYWIESLLLVPPEGTPALATALSKRVANWIRTTAWLDEIVNTPKPGTAIGQGLANLG